MNEIINEEFKIENLIFEIRGKQVMLDSETSATKCNHYIYGNILTHFDIVKTISVLINFADASAKLRRKRRI